MVRARSARAPSAPMALRADLEAIDCHLSHQKPRPALLAHAFGCGARGLLLCVNLTLPRLLLAVAKRISVMRPPSWNISSRPAGIDRWAKPLGCAEADSWSCMFGRRQHAPPSRCKPGFALRSAYRNRTLAALLVLRRIVLDGSRESPLLSPGPELPHWMEAPPRRPWGSGTVTLINVSLHVRMGDSCDLVENRTLHDVPSWTSTSGGSARVTRRCVHPLVYVRQLRATVLTLWAENATLVESVLLATDSTEAASSFRDASLFDGLLPADVPAPRVVMRSLDRAQFDYRPGRGRSSAPTRWIEHRRNLSASVTVSALEDLRLLSRGHFLVAAMCSHFAVVVWNLMVARHARTLPFESVDSCVPFLDPWAYARSVGKGPPQEDWSLAARTPIALARTSTQYVHSIVPRIVCYAGSEHMFAPVSPTSGTRGRNCWTTQSQSSA